MKNHQNEPQIYRLIPHFAGESVSPLLDPNLWHYQKSRSNWLSYFHSSHRVNLHQIELQGLGSSKASSELHRDQWKSPIQMKIVRGRLSGGND